MAPKLVPRGSRDALGAGLVLKAAFGHVFRRFSTPRHLKNLKSAITSSLFVVFAILSTARSGSQKAPHNGTQIDPTTVPRGLQRPKNAIQNRTSLFDRFSNDFPSQKRSPKSTQKSLKNRPRRPRASRKPPGSHLWINVGAILDPFWPAGASLSKVSGRIVHYCSCFPARLFSCALLCCSPCLCCSLCALSSVAGSGAPAPVRSGHRASLNSLLL